MTRDEIFAAIIAERGRQAARWGGDHNWGHGDCSSPHVQGPVKVAVLTEEMGEVARAMLDESRDDLRDELIQLAASCVAWLEAL